MSKKEIIMARVKRITVIILLIVISSGALVAFQCSRYYSDKVEEYNYLRSECIDAYDNFKKCSFQLLNMETEITDDWIHSYTTLIIFLDYWNKLYWDFGEKECLPSSIYNSDIAEEAEKQLSEHGYDNVSYEKAVVNDIQHDTLLLYEKIFNYYTMMSKEDSLPQENSQIAEIEDAFSDMDDKYKILDSEMEKNLTEMFKYCF